MKSRLNQNKCIAALMILLGGIGIFRIAIVLPSRIITNDFAHYYISSRMIAEGISPYRSEIKPEYDRLGFVYTDRINHGTNTPTLCWLFAPIALFDPHESFWLWTILQLIFLMLIIIILSKLLERLIPFQIIMMIAAIVLISNPVYYNFILSQCQLLLTAMILAAYFFYKEKMYRLAILFAALAGTIKFFPFVLLPWFLWRPPVSLKEKLQNTAGAILAVVSIFYLTDLSMWIEFFQYGLKIIRDNSINQTMNYSLPSFIFNFIFWLYDFNLEEAFLFRWSLITTVIGFIFILFSYKLCRMSNNDEDVEFSVLNLAMIIGSTTAWGHYLVFLIFPLSIGLILIRSKNIRKMTLLFGISTILLVFSGTESAFIGSSYFVNILINYVPLYSMLLIFALFRREIINSKKDGA
jgi:hypothetical protein